MVDYDKLAASRPVNASAARAVSQKGEHWNPKATFTGLLKEAPLMRDPGPFDLTGTKMGRLTVVGKAAKKGADGLARWVCRCNCGNYMTVRSRTVSQRPIDRCGECDYLDQLRAGTIRGMKNAGPAAAQARRQARGVA